jgi:hypothetical protein
MSPDLQMGESPTELGLWPKDSEQLNLRGSAEDTTPTLLPEYRRTPSVGKNMFFPLRFSNSGRRTKLCGSKPPYSVMNDYGLVCQCSINVLVRCKGKVFPAQSMNACNESKVMVSLFLKLNTRWR